MERESLSCTPKCERRPSSADAAKYFDPTSGRPTSAAPSPRRQRWRRPAVGTRGCRAIAHRLPARAYRSGSGKRTATAISGRAVRGLWMTGRSGESVRLGACTTCIALSPRRKKPMHPSVNTYAHRRYPRLSRASRGPSRQDQRLCQRAGTEARLPGRLHRRGAGQRGCGTDDQSALLGGAEAVICLMGNHERIALDALQTEEAAQHWLTNARLTHPRFSPRPRGSRFCPATCSTGSSPADAAR